MKNFFLAPISRDTVRALLGTLTIVAFVLFVVFLARVFTALNAGDTHAATCSIYEIRAFQCHRVGA